MARIHLHCHLDVQLAIRAGTCRAGDIDYLLPDEVVCLLRDEGLAEAATPFLATHGTQDTTERSEPTQHRLSISSTLPLGALNTLRERRDQIRRAREVVRWAAERPSWETLLEIEAVDPDDVRVPHPPPDLVPDDRADRDADVTTAFLLILWARELTLCVQAYIDTADTNADEAINDLLGSLEGTPPHARRALGDAGKSVLDFLPDPVRADLVSLTFDSDCRGGSD